jgi:hypothetical protein
MGGKKKQWLVFMFLNEHLFRILLITWGKELHLLKDNLEIDCLRQKKKKKLLNILLRLFLDRCTQIFEFAF